MKKALAMMATLAVALCVLGGCSSPANDPKSENFEPKKDTVKAEQIDWGAESAVIDKYRRIAFSYKNNSDVDIIDLECLFSLKPDVTPEILRQTFDALKENGWTTSQLDELSSVTEEQMMTFTLSGAWRLPVEPGSTSGKDAMTVGYSYINTMDQFDLFEPNMMVIKYITEDGKLYEETYDFKSGTYSLSDEVIDTHQWSDSELASQLPRPEDLLVTELSDSDTRFTFETAGTTQSEFENFVAACKEKGFTKNVTQGDSYFYASSSDGKYDLDLFYYPEDGSITAYLDVV